MDFLVLGPLEVRRDGEAVEVRGSKRRALLALLVIHANEVIRTDRLVDELWGEDPPGNAASALQSHVSRLRRDLGEDVVGTKPWGYVLRTEPAAVDLGRFETLVAEARTLAAHERRAKLSEALALWRGPALADLTHEPALAAEAAQLDELRLSALEQRLDADLELGATAEVVAELENLVAKHPARERLRGQLILALYRSGRQAEALETYRETRRLLVEELGIEPSAELRELERAILRQDPALAVAAPPRKLDAIAGLEETSRWRWPRSPLVLSVVLLLAGAGAASAVFLTRNGQPVSVSAAPASSSTASPTSPTTAPMEAPQGTTTDDANQSTTQTVVQRPAPRPRPTPRPPHTQPTVPSAPRTDARPPATTTTPKPPTATPTTTRASTNTDWIYEFNDDFTDTAFDHTFWHLATTGTGITATEQNGRLELSVAPEVVWDASGGADAHHGTQCLLTGDFDATVQFELLEWPEADGVSLNFGAYMRNGRDTTWAFIARSGKTSTASSTETYYSDVGASKHSPQTTDTAGALRLKRKQGTLTTFYRYRGGWITVSSGRARGPANLILGLATSSGAFGAQAARAVFDSFHATATLVDCSGFPLPPRRPRR